MKQSIGSLIKTFFAFGQTITPDNPNYRRIYLINGISSIIALFAIIQCLYGIVMYPGHELILFTGITSVISLLILLLLRLTKKVELIATILVGLLLFIESYVFRFGTQEHVGLVWLIVFIPFFFMLKGSKKGSLISSLYIIFFIATVLPTESLDTLLNISLCMLILFFNSYYYERGQELSQKKLHEAYTEAYEHSIVDELTHLYNRRFFNESFPKELRSSFRKSRYLAFFMLDIDHFKLYNDNYGHQQGDYALEQVGVLIKEHLQRGGDCPFRLGGEEFGGLLYGNAPEDITMFVDELRKKIEGLALEHNFSSCAKVITASIGVQIVPHDRRITEDELYKMCDDLLYKAKSLEETVQSLVSGES